jgi:DNA polymerase-3 subunit epsilon
MTRGSDLLDSLRARLEAAGLQADGQSADLLLRCNGFEIIALLSDLLIHVAEDTGTRQFRMDLSEDGPGALIRLSWQGAPLAVGALEAWLDQPLEVGDFTATLDPLPFEHI